MSFYDRILDSLLGLEQTQAVEDIHFAFGAAWARNAPAWVFFGCVAMAAIAAVFYVRYQRNRHRGMRAALAILRAAALCTLVILLAEPILRITETTHKRPLLWLLFDGTDSMGIVDELPSDERAGLAAAVGLKEEPDSAVPAESPQHSRTDYVKALIQRPEKDNLLQRLSKDFRLQAYLFDTAQGVRSLELATGKGKVEPKHVAEQLTNTGKVTAIGAALDDLAQRYASTNLGGVVVFSDFNQNAGPQPVEAAKRLGVPVYTVGVGATTAVDVSIDLDAGMRVKKDEETKVTVILRQEGLDSRQEGINGQSVRVTVSAEPLGGLQGAASSRVQIADKTVQLVGRTQPLDIPWTPDKVGRFLLVAEVDPVPGEVVRENNRAGREIFVTDEFMRLLFVEYEPTWEWRFIKEVFYRDPLVGMQGFRTFLFSSDPRVRKVNQLFVPTMIPQRKDFFAHDVIFVGDVPASGLSPRFCEMAKEFVGGFGGGLVVIAGSRFGPKELAGTALAEMLPVIPDPGARVSDRQEFKLKLTGMAESYGFMNLADTPQENQKAWDNLGPLPWYQPVSRPHPLAYVLAEHPTYTCIDGKTKQPIIAVREYGKGQVVYIGFNEMWRLRKKYGEKYYRKFWATMIQDMSLRHALGSQKRFVVRTDRPKYQADEEAILTVEAYNQEFKPLEDKDLFERKLQAELILPAEGSLAATNIQPLGLTESRKGIYETRFRVRISGEHRVRVTDPITKKPVECTFQVLTTPVERQRAVRNVDVQDQIAVQTQGKSYDLRTVQNLADQIRANPRTEKLIEVIPLTNTWLSFALVVLLLFGEWLLRKWVNLS